MTLIVAVIRGKTMIDTKLLEILACPACKGDVEYDTKNEKLICIDCKRKYPVRDGIPVMLIDEAENAVIVFLLRYFSLTKY